MTPKRLPATFAAAALALAAAAATAAETQPERGRYLMSSIVACGNCHTPMGPNGPLPGQELAGGTVFDEQPFTAYAPNITPDKDTGIGSWTDAQIATAIRDGRRPDGSLIAGTTSPSRPSSTASAPNTKLNTWPDR